MIRPERLLASARRLYGDRMEALWGEFLPVPEASVHLLEGGETLTLGGRTLEVAYTPGHAIHHVSYLDRATGTAFVGDTAGMRVCGEAFLVPVTPPPDVDLPAWRKSLDRLRAWRPDRLFLTHFGPAEDVEDHLEAYRRKLEEWVAWVRRSLDDGSDDAARASAFQEEKMAEMRAEVPDPETRVPYEHMGQPAPSWHGIARYWRKQALRSLD